MSDKVDYQESLSINVGRFLLSKGFDSNSLVATDSLGILRKDADARPRKYLFGLITQKSRRGFLGTVWFSNSMRGAGEQNWVFEAYGRKYVELVRQLAEEMASTFNVRIALRLVRDQPDVETYMSDYDV